LFNMPRTTKAKTLRSVGVNASTRDRMVELFTPVIALSIAHDGPFDMHDARSGCHASRARPKAT